MKKYLKTIMLTFIALILAVSFASCSGMEEMFEDEEISKDTRAMLDALIEDDFNAAYSTVSGICTKEQFKPTYDQMRQALNGATTYTIKLNSFHKNFQSDVTVITASYKVETDKGIFLIEVASQSDNKHLTAFYIAPFEKTDLYYTGTLGTMDGASLFQWIMLLLNLISLAVIVFAIIKCAKADMRFKGLWIAIIAVGMLAIVYTTQGTIKNLAFNFGFSFFGNYSALIVYGSGKTVCRVLLPIGAILFFALRKFIVNNQENTPAPPTTQGSVDEQPAQMFAQVSVEETTVSQNESGNTNQELNDKDIFTN